MSADEGSAPAAAAAPAAPGEGSGGGAAAAAAPAPVIKKRGKKRFRKARVVDEEEPAGASGSPAAVDSDLLATLREEQRGRVRKAGVGADELAKVAVARDRSRRPAAVEEAAVGVVEEDDAAKAEKVDKLIGGTFAPKKADVQQVITEKQMEEFISERMGKGAEPDDDELLGPDDMAELAEEDKILNQPLRPVVEPIVPVAAADPADESELPFASGLAEVALPMSYRIKNLEATERARQRAISEKQPWETSGRVAGSYTANYNIHRREFAMAQRGLDPHQRGGGPGGAAGAPRPPRGDRSGVGAGAGARGGDRGRSGGPGAKMSSDGAVMSRFIKSSYRRR